MKHTLHCFFLLFLLTYSASAQDSKIQIEPATVEQNYDGDLSNVDLDIELTAVVKNISDDTLLMTWKRNIINQPTEWLTRVCDNNFCYESHIGTNFDLNIGIDEPVILLPDSSFNMILHVLPKTQPGIGQFELPFFLKSNPDEALGTITYIANIGEVTSLDEDRKNQRIAAYPTPTTDYFQLSASQDIDQIVVYSMLGKRVKTFYEIFEGKKYDIIDLPNGLYLISLIDSNKGVVKTLRLSKRVFRP
ncbi:MAG: T9SS type A sorting domain-containing protein [Pseudomonadota bacterium]